MPQILAAVTALSVIYLSYRRGWLITKRTRAVLFCFRPGKARDKVTLNSCSGWVRHAVQFQEKRKYAFTFDGQLSNGTAEAVLLDRQKRVILHLDPTSPKGTAALEPGCRYFIRWSFHSATGKCALHWCAASQ